jgi:hypothetical protein
MTMHDGPTGPNDNELRREACSMFSGTDHLLFTCVIV